MCMHAFEYECVFLFYYTVLNSKSGFMSGVNWVSEDFLHIAVQQLMVAHLFLTFGQIKLQFLF